MTQHIPLSQLNTQQGNLVGYARVSTIDQNLDAQLDALRRAGCVRIYHDFGVSGAKCERPGLNQLLNELASGDTLVVCRLDRLGRSVQHLSDLIVRLDANGVQFCALSEGINTNTHGGRLTFHIFAAVAEFERALIRERTCEGMQAAKLRGSTIGRPRALSDQEIYQVRSCILEDGKSYTEVADKFGVSPSTVKRAIQRVIPKSSPNLA